MSKDDTKNTTASPAKEKGEPEEKKDTVLTSAQAYVKQRFLEDLAPRFLFHNYAYAKEMAEVAAELAEAEKLDDEQTRQVVLAAWFTPLGFIAGGDDPYATSVAELRKWAKANDVALNGAEAWLPAAREATPDSPLPVRVLHDAGWSWLGRKRFDRRSDLLRLEREARDSKDGDPIKFGEEMQELLMRFRYLTLSARSEYDKRRRKNAAGQHSDNYKIEQNEVKARTGKNFGRGIDTMYRTAFRNHINLSRIADGKANMMISINTIILSIVITVSGASLSFFEETFFENPEFLVPIISLLLSSLIAVVFAVFSARPSVTEYRVKKDKLIKSKEASLLYFGNFLKLEKNEFIEYMAEMKLDQNALYDDLARDLYDLGQVMHKKYLLLTISYNTFVGGLALAVISFLIVYLLNIL